MRYYRYTCIRPHCHVTRGWAAPKGWPRACPTVTILCQSRPSGSPASRTAPRSHSAHSRPTPGRSAGLGPHCATRRRGAPQRPPESGGGDPQPRGTIGRRSGRKRPRIPGKPRQVVSEPGGRRKAEARHAARERGGRHPAPPSVGDPGERPARRRIPTRDRPESARRGGGPRGQRAQARRSETAGGIRAERSAPAGAMLSD